MIRIQTEQGLLSQVSLFKDQVLNRLRSIRQRSGHQPWWQDPEVEQAEASEAMGVEEGSTAITEVILQVKLEKEFESFVRRLKGETRSELTESEKAEEATQFLPLEDVNIEGIQVLEIKYTFQPTQKVYRLDDEHVYMWDKPYEECSGEGDLSQEM